MYFIDVFTPIKSILNVFWIYRVIVKKLLISNKTKIDESLICISNFFLSSNPLLSKEWRLRFYIIIFDVVPVLLFIPTNLRFILGFPRSSHKSETLSLHRAHHIGLHMLLTRYLILKLELVAIVIRDRH